MTGDPPNSVRATPITAIASRIAIKKTIEPCSEEQADQVGAKQSCPAHKKQDQESVETSTRVTVSRNGCT